MEDLRCDKGHIVERATHMRIRKDGDKYINECLRCVGYDDAMIEFYNECEDAFFFSIYDYEDKLRYHNHHWKHL
jgi:hypothetical protein